ncbi:MAG: CPXCG motif-containing cysteine-rich protein [Cryomorphaceae bacterium]|nr:CPXCG motif-containing cysteine-rich protein [Flavobacteriales bacterium]
MIQHFFQCPYCFELISMLLDPSLPHQEYVEDCEVCCNPIRINYTVEDGEVSMFEAEILGQ